MGKGSKEKKEYVLSPNGYKIDPNTQYGKQLRHMREPRNRKIIILEDLIKRLISEEVFKYGFGIYIHRTKPENVESIKLNGLNIKEKSGYIESTLSKCFDSNSEDLNGDFEYLWNSISDESLYGKAAIVVVLPKSEEIIQQITTLHRIPTKYIMASVVSGIPSINFKYRQALESEKLSESLSTTDIGARTVPRAKKEDKDIVKEIFEKLQESIEKGGIFKDDW